MVTQPTRRPLSTLQRLALQAAARDLETAQQQLAAVLTEIGAVPGRNYRVEGDHLVDVPDVPDG